jgi:pyruvate formate lyase activating enzyme
LTTPAEKAPITALIFDIKKFAIHDGPGIRTTVFFKGCPLACWWCHNPEAMSPKPELVLFEEKCIGCGECFRVCPEGAHEKKPDGSRVYHRDKCVLCGACAEVCYAEALVMEGRRVTVEELMVELRKDVPFYENSGGGITLSGGEPTLQHEFALALLKQCKSEGLHTAVDTSGQTPWRVFKTLLPYIDIVLYDVKHIDERSHRTHTGSHNHRILENLQRLGESGTPIEIRMPVIPTINDDGEDIERTARLLAGIESITRIELLPYHKLGASKYARLDMKYRLAEMEPPTAQRMETLAGLIRSHGLKVHVGS